MLVVVIEIHVSHNCLSIFILVIYALLWHIDGLSPQDLVPSFLCISKDFDDSCFIEVVSVEHIIPHEVVQDTTCKYNVILSCYEVVLHWAFEYGEMFLKNPEHSFYNISKRDMSPVEQTFNCLFMLCLSNTPK